MSSNFAGVIMTPKEKEARQINRDILVNACFGFDQYKKDFGRIPYSVIDIGAHIGGLTLRAMEQDVPYILAIEADGENYNYLAENVKRQTKRIGYKGYVEYLHKAFCNTSGDIVELIVPCDYGGNSGQRSLYYSKTAMNIYKSYTIKHVKTINIDDIIEKIESYGVYTIDFFKCDIEGAEFAAMPMHNRTKEFLSHVKYMDIELHPWINTDYYNPDLFFDIHKEFDKDKRIIGQYIEFLRDCGFYIPENILDMNRDYLKLVTHNEKLCYEKGKEVKKYALCI